MEQKSSINSRRRDRTQFDRSGLFGARERTLILIGVLGAVAIFTWLIGGLKVHSDTSAEIAFESPLDANGSFVVEAGDAANLLYNGNMDQVGFYWRPPNHWIAGGWFEWFSTKPYNYPEFGDGGERGMYQTAPSSQRLQLWGDDYAAGLMQSVSVAPCAYYQFQAYGQSRPGSENPPPVDVQSHMKVGIEPYGWMSGRSISDYDPGLEPTDFPATVVWSPEATYNFTFGIYTVTTEALSNEITAILYAYPEIDLDGGVTWNDTVWDSASLVQVSPPNGLLIPLGSLPAADGKISDVVSTTVFNAATFQWQTTEPAFSQILYHYVGPASDTTWPPIADHTDAFEFLTDIEQTAKTSHSIKLSDLSPASVYDVALLSRRWTGSACETSVHVTRVQTTDLIVPEGVLPQPSDDVWDVHVIPLQGSAYVWWRSNASAYSQVLYGQVMTASIAPSQTYKIYFPLLSASTPQVSTSHFEFRTTPVPNKDTVHWYYLSDLEMDTEYDFVAVIAWTEDNADHYARSELERFTTGVYAQTVHIPWNETPPQVTEALCAQAGVCPEDY